MKLDQIIKLDILHCNLCREGTFENRQSSIVCKVCGRTVQREGDTLFFEDKSFSESQTLDYIDLLKHRLKKYRKFYKFLRFVMSPIYLKNDLLSFLNKYSDESKIILNLGSGNTIIKPNVINVDLINYDNVNIVSNITSLPFLDNSVDIISLDSVLEHVDDPKIVVQEAHRILKPTGKIYASVPFMLGFHASPYDFTRWTIEGVEKAFNNFECIELKQEGGPTSALLWIFQEWICSLLSFGIVKLFNLLYIVTLLFIWPLKYLDIYMQKLKTSNNIASGFIFIGSKK